MKKKKQFIVFIIAVVLLVLGDFGYNVYSKKKIDVENSIDAYQQKLLDAKLENKKLQEKIDIAQIDNEHLQDRISELHHIIDKLYDEKTNYIISDQIGRKVLQAFANNDINQLNELLPINVKAYKGYLEKTVNGSTSKVSFQPIQSMGLDNNNGTISIWHYYNDEESKTFVILYNIVNELNSTSIDCRMTFRIINEKDTQPGVTKTTFKLVDIEIGKDLIHSDA